MKNMAKKLQMVCKETWFSTPQPCAEGTAAQLAKPLQSH